MASIKQGSKFAKLTGIMLERQLQVPLDTNESIYGEWMSCAFERNPLVKRRNKKRFV
jgi:hypothetical protein